MHEDEINTNEGSEVLDTHTNNAFYPFLFSFLAELPAEEGMLVLRDVPVV